MKYQLQWHNLRVSYSQSGIRSLPSKIRDQLSFQYVDRARWNICRGIPLLDITFFKCIYFDDARLLELVTYRQSF